MKNKRLFFLLLLCTYGMPAFAQYFTNQTQSSIWRTDSIYKFEAKVRRYDIQFKKGELVQSPRAAAFLDSLAAFLQEHPELYIEVGVHKELAYPDWDNYITKKRARSVGAYLTGKGIPSTQIKPKGYGFTQPMYREKDLRIAKTKKQRDSLIDFNNRVEFQVIAINPRKAKLFSLTDHSFIPGSILRNHHLLIEPQTNTLSLRREDSLFLDSMVYFLKQHPSFVLEVCTYADIRQYWKAGIMYSNLNSKKICDYIIAKGISAERLLPKGYGDSWPLHSETEIKALTSTAEQEKMYLENKRVEFKLISTR